MKIKTRMQIKPRMKIHTILEEGNYDNAEYDDDDENNKENKKTNYRKIIVIAIVLFYGVYLIRHRKI